MWRVSTPTPITIGSTSITWEVFSTASGGGGEFLENVVEDPTPQLGGDLDINTSDITGTGNINITGNIDMATSISLAISNRMELRLVFIFMRQIKRQTGAGGASVLLMEA
jgi:hypothetical protein